MTKKKKYLQAAEAMKVILDDIYDYGINAKYAKKHHLTLNQIRIMEKIYCDNRNGQVHYTIDSKVASLCNDIGFVVVEHGIGFCISFE